MNDRDAIMLDIKPLSVNEAWQGKRFKTSKYAAYRKELVLRLPPIENFPEPPYSVYYEFGLSNPKSDFDNPIKPFQDALQERYGFDDKHIVDARVKKIIVPKGKEYIRFSIRSVKREKTIQEPSIMDRMFQR